MNKQDQKIINEINGESNSARMLGLVMIISFVVICLIIGIFC